MINKFLKIINMIRLIRNYINLQILIISVIRENYIYI